MMSMRVMHPPPRMMMWAPVCLHARHQALHQQEEEEGAGSCRPLPLLASGARERVGRDACTSLQPACMSHGGAMRVWVKVCCCVTHALQPAAHGRALAPIREAAGGG